ncbi:FAD-binding oxidoreductase [Labrys miyagiensis]
MLDLLNVLPECLGGKGWLSQADAAPYQRDWLDRFGVAPLGVARPADTQEVATVVKACRKAGVRIVPQGGNTSLCGGAVAQEPNSVILSLSRMNHIAPPDAASGSVLVEAGVVLSALHAALEAHGLIFPMHLGAEGSARIGGLIGTNAGGSQAFRYGLMQDLVLGLEVVLPDGQIWNGLRAVQKDNAGYQLRKLFAGSEGTLGVITRVVLQLYPAPRSRVTALLALPNHEAAIEFGTLVRQEAAEFLSALEFFSDLGVSLALKHIEGLAFPLGNRDDAYVLIELTAGSALVPLDDILASLLEQGMAEGLVSDGALAMSEAQRAHFWRLREEQPEGQRLEGPQIKNDICVPPGRIAAFIAAGAPLCDEILPGARVNPFGHLADGNIHYNLSAPEGGTLAAEKIPALVQALATLATDMGGSFAAEHGLGRSKVALADGARSPTERTLMRALKQAIDPAGVMNPGVVVAALRKE